MVIENIVSGTNLMVHDHHNYSVQCVVATYWDENVLNITNEKNVYLQKKALRCINKKFVERIERGEREHLKITGT